MPKHHESVNIGDVPRRHAPAVAPKPKKAASLRPLPKITPVKPPEETPVPVEQPTRRRRRKNKKAE